MEYADFEVEFKKHPICGIDIIGPELTYSSDCPCCEPNSLQWRETCRRFYKQGAVIRGRGWWYTIDGKPAQ